MSFRRISLALVPTLLVGACSPDLAEHDYRQHYPLAVSKHDAVAVVAAPEAGQPLSLPDRSSLDQMGREHQRRGAGTVTVAVAAEDGEAARATAKAFGDSVAAGLNLPAGEVEVRVVAAGQPPPGLALVTVPVWGADVPECGQWQWEPNPDFSNRNTANFGCATQRNLGLMVQNPADLVRPRDSSDRDGGRAVDVLDKYRKGAATSSAKEDAAGSTASDVGK